MESTGGPETAEDGANSLTVVREQSSEQKPAESGPRPEEVSSDCCSFQIGARNTGDTSDSSVTVTAAGVAKRLLRRPLPPPSRRAPVGIATARLASGQRAGGGTGKASSSVLGIMQKIVPAPYSGFKAEHRPANKRRAGTFLQECFFTVHFVAKKKEKYSHYRDVIF